MLKNSSSGFGKVTIVIHWISALVIAGQFSLGLYMLSLDYYDPYYLVLPYFHKSIGILFALLLVFRITWTLANPRPDAAPGVANWERRIAVLTQMTMLGLLMVVVTLGYLISTADGKSIHVFNWFEVPATVTSIENQEDWAGEWHYRFALSVIVLAAVHILAAFKHHFINRDTTLLRMLGKG
jgi:cytochrome b561